VWHSPAALDLGAGVGVALSPVALDLGAGVGVAAVSRETPRDRTRGRGDGLGLGVGFGGLKHESYFI
jgi:hypothetical protein